MKTNTDTTTNTIKICDCGHEPSKHESFTTGYGIDKEGKTFCYECCAENDKEQMRNTGSIILYLEGNKQVSNWPGSLKLPVMRFEKGNHNIARHRYDVWFKFEGQNWHGVQYGDNTQICHCKRIK